MRKTRTIFVAKTQEVEITCDKCGRVITPDDFIEWQEVICLNFTGGFGSVFGDEMSFEIDLCQHCLKKTLGRWIRRVDA